MEFVRAPSKSPALWPCGTAAAQQARSARIRDALEAACKHLASAVQRGRALLASIPRIESDESAFRKHMAEQSEAVAAMNQGLAGALSAVELLQGAVSEATKQEEVPEHLEDFTREGQDVADLSYYYVSLYAALSMFRNPCKSYEVVKKLGQVMAAIDKLPRREDWTGASLLPEMRAFAARPAAEAAAAGPAKRRAEGGSAAPPQPPQKRGRGGGAAAGGGARGRGKRAAAGDATGRGAKKSK